MSTVAGKYILYGVAPTPEEHKMDQYRRVYYTNVLNAAREFARLTPGGLNGGPVRGARRKHRRFLAGSVL